MYGIIIENVFEVIWFSRYRISNIKMKIYRYMYDFKRYNQIVLFKNIV